MVYITKSNAEGILRCTSIKMDTVEELYPRKLWMFTKRELTHLMRYKTFMENAAGYFAAYKAIKRKDTFTYVNEAFCPSYHKDLHCERLGKGFTNYVIPVEIQEKGKDECIKFRKWFKAHKELLEDNPDKFYKQLKKKYGVEELEKTEVVSSGVVRFIDLTVEELEEEINTLLTDTAKYYHKTKVKPILNKYRKYYYDVEEGYTIPEITTDHTNEEIVSVLLEYKTQYKKPLESLLKAYFRAKYNPDLKFDKSILEQLGFKPCSCCCK